jgi:hypothetical protein
MPTRDVRAPFGWNRARFNALTIALLFALATSASFAGININVEYVRKSVVFLYGADAAGNVDPSQPLGTAFIVEVPLVSTRKRLTSYS